MASYQQQMGDVSVYLLQSLSMDNVLALTLIVMKIKQ